MQAKCVRCIWFSRCGLQLDIYLFCIHEISSRIHKHSGRIHIDREFSSARCDLLSHMNHSRTHIWVWSKFTPAFVIAVRLIRYNVHFTLDSSGRDSENSLGSGQRIQCFETMTNQIIKKLSATRLEFFESSPNGNQHKAKTKKELACQHSSELNSAYL